MREELTKQESAKMIYNMMKQLLGRNVWRRSVCLCVSVERIPYIHMWSCVQCMLNQIMMTECFGCGRHQIIIAVGNELMNDYANVKYLGTLTTRLNHRSAFYIMRNTCGKMTKSSEVKICENSNVLFISMNII